MHGAHEARRYRFGMFEFDPVLLELRRDGRRVRLRPQPLKLLALLVSRPGDVVSRDDIQAALWGDDTFVDFEQGVNHCIKQLRDALRDSAESPRFIETVPRHGYRFIAPVHPVPRSEPRLADALPAIGQTAAPASAHAAETAAPAARRHLLWYPAIALLGSAVLIAVAMSGRADVPRPIGAGGTPPVLAVLPFTTTSSDSTLGAGLAHAISSRLGAQRAVAVRAAWPPDDAAKQTPAHEMARATGATWALTGSLTPNGDSIVVLTELVDVGTGSIAWSARFRVETDELFNVETVIAERVVNALQLRLAAAEQERLRRRYTANAAAYDAYVRGRAALVEYTPDGAVRAVAAFEQALDRDNGYALARAGLAMACADMYLRFSGPEDVDRWGMCAEGESRAALDVDPDLAEAHLARAMVARKREFDWGSAIVESQRALVLNANLEQGHFISAAAYYHLGYMEEALIELERGRRLRGQDTIEPIRIEALVALFSGNFVPARAQLEEVSRRSSLAIGDTYLGLAYYYTGNIERARPMLDTLAQSASASTATRAGAALASVLAAGGESSAALVSVNRVLAQEYRDHHVAYSLGAAYAQLGNVAEAVRWLGTAADSGFPCAIWFERDPLLAPLRRHPEFALVQERVHAQRQAALSRLDALGR